MENKQLEGANEQTQLEERKEALTKEDVQKMIQSETDRVRTEYSKKLKEKEQELEQIRTEKMSEDERKQHEFEKLQKELVDKEQAIKQRELKLKTIDLLKKEEIPLDFQEFVMATDEEATTERVKAFKRLWNDAIKEVVDNTFRENGRTPKKPTDSSTVLNPWKKENLNLTEQGRILKENPELAKQLMAVAK